MIESASTSVSNSRHILPESFAFFFISRHRSSFSRGTSLPPRPPQGDLASEVMKWSTTVDPLPKKDPGLC